MTEASKTSFNLILNTEAMRTTGDFVFLINETCLGCFYPSCNIYFSHILHRMQNTYIIQVYLDKSDIDKLYFRYVGKMFKNGYCWRLCTCSSRVWKSRTHFSTGIRVNTGTQSCQCTPHSTV